MIVEDGVADSLDSRMVKNTITNSIGTTLIVEFNTGFSVAYEKLPVERVTYLRTSGDQIGREQSREPAGDFKFKYCLLPEGLYSGSWSSRECFPVSDVEYPGNCSSFSNTVDIEFIAEYLSPKVIKSIGWGERVHELYEQAVAPLGIKEVKYWDFELPIWMKDESNWSKVWHWLKVLFSERSIANRIMNEQNVWEHNRSGEDIALLLGPKNKGTPKRFDYGPELVLPYGIKVYEGGGTKEVGIKEYCKARWFIEGNDELVKEIGEIHDEAEQWRRAKEEFETQLKATDHRALLKQVGFF